MPAIGSFGRAWALSITTENLGQYIIRSLVDNKSEVPLRITFDIETMMQLAYWRGDITIYNLSPPGAQNIGGSLTPSAGTPLPGNLNVVMGNDVTLSAGYEETYGKFDSTKNLIYAGKVFQPVWTRVAVVDFTLTLRCLFGLMEDTMNFISFALPAGPNGITYYDTLNEIANGKNGAGIAVDADAGSIAVLKGQSFTRDQVIHDKPYNLFQDLLRQKALSYWVTPPAAGSATPTLRLRQFGGTETPTPYIAYGPPNLPGPYTTGGTLRGTVKPTIIGVPQQTQYGVTFKVLLDAEVQIGMTIQIAPGTLIAPFEFKPFSDFPARPAHNGIFIVAGLRHVGDSRGHGEDWYTEITAMMWDFFSAYSSYLSVTSQPSGTAQ